MLSLFNAKEKQGSKTPLFFHNTLTAKKDEFSLLRGKEVRMYNCGPTVYDYQHIGNLRPYVFADVLRRVLRANGYQVDQVINITDVGHLVSDGDEGEDKIEKGARQRGESVEEMVKQITDTFFKDLDTLLVDRSHVRFPRATEYIQEQIALIKSLEEKGYTYTTSDGVYFDTSRFPRYGALGNIKLDELKEGARVEENSEKKHATDFALWKFSPKQESRLQEWESPWGKGFPGWHIECSAMAIKLLGKQLDIHTGGIDHIPVHHNNEIAQSEAATGTTPFSRFWLHNAFITIEGRKISKSIGNTIYIRNLIDRGYTPLSYRYLLLTARYSAPLNFTWDSIHGAHMALTRLHKFFVDELRNVVQSHPSEKYMKEFRRVLNDDLDTPKALALVWELVKDAEVPAGSKRATLLRFDMELGLGLAGLATLPDSALKVREIRTEDLSEEIQKLIAEREIARNEKDWLTADRIRADLHALGYAIEDSAEGPHIEKIQT